MPDRPYTDADLRTEAAHQHRASLDDPDFMGIGEQMDGSRIPSTVTDPDAPITSRNGGRTWDMLARDDFDAAQRSIDNLLTGAADTSAWAINLGADGLEPDPRALDAGDHRLRVHFAFAPDISDADRADLIGQFAAFMTTGLT